MPTHLPAPLAPGSRVGIIAPASAPLDPASLDEGLSTLRKRGLKIVRSRTDLSGAGYLAGEDDARAAELNDMLRRTDVDALMCVRGGYGTTRILDRLDYAAAAAHRKILIGYSDITALQLALFKKASWTSLSGSMVAVEWPDPDPGEEALFWRVAGGEAPIVLASPNGSVMHTLRPGKATGTLLGGNLAMVARLIGTPYLPDMSGAILFLEDVGESPYRIDGLLSQLRLAGLLSSLSGVILGAFTDADPTPGRPTRSLETVFDDYFGQAPYPVVSGFNYGHFRGKVTVPIGVAARLDADAGPPVLTIIEPVAGPSATA